MTRLQRYIFLQMLGPFLMTLAGLTFVGLLTQSLSQLDLLIERGQSPWTLVQITSLATPQFMAIVMPIAVFAAVATTYSRLQQDSELVVAASSGMGPWTLAQPAFRLAIFAVLFGLAVNIFVQPVTYREMRERLFAIRSDLATMLVREGEFRSAVEGLTVHARKVERDGELSGLLITDSRNVAAPVTYVARAGAVIRVRDKPAIALRDGSVQRRAGDGQIEILGFSSFVLELGDFATEDSVIFFKPSDRRLHELFSPDRTQDYDRRRTGAVYAEGHRRLAAPLVCLSAAALAVLAVLGGTHSRNGRGGRIGWAAGGLVALLLVIAGVGPAIEETPALNVLAYLLPLAAVWFATRFMRRWRGEDPRTRAERVDAFPPPHARAAPRPA
jgi:lipopolysaccharide export system permease protein